jgi:hypothetical protein
MKEPTQNDKNIINLIGNYFSEYIYCLDINHNSNQSFKTLKMHFDFFNKNNYIRTNMFYMLLNSMAKNDTLLPNSLSPIFNKLNTNFSEEDKVEVLNLIEKRLNYTNSNAKELILDIQSPFMNMSNHSLVIDKKFIQGSLDLTEHKTNLGQVLSILESYNVILPFLPNFHISYDNAPSKKGHLSPSNNHILINNNFVNTSTFMHELTHFIDYICASEKNLYSIEFHHGKLNNQLPLFNNLLNNLDNVFLNREQKIDTLIKTLKYYFHVTINESDINSNLKPFLNNHVSDSFLKDEFENYLTQEQNVKSLFTTMSEYFDKKSNTKAYFSQPHERLARIAQSVLEDDGDKLVNNGYSQYKVIVPLGTEQKYYIAAWLNVLEKEVGNYIKNHQSNILNIQAKNTQFFDIKEKIELNRNNDFIPKSTLNKSVIKNK